MSEKTKHLSLLLMVMLLAVGFSALGGGTASAHTASHPATVSSGQLARASAKQQTYWTSARMMSARSADTLITNITIPKARLTPQTPGRSTASGSAQPVAPKGATQVKPVIKNALRVTDAFSFPQSYYSYYPYSTVGKIFFTDPQTGYNYVCSGASVNSTNLNVVDTAGHCVVGGGSAGDWYTNWAFCPQYYYGYAPYGCWYARYSVTSYDWFYSGSLEDDFGDVAVWPNAYGNLVNVVGGTGWAYGQSTSQYFYPFGYPAEAPFDGNSMYYCADTGTAYGFDDGTVISAYCDMTGGSSGGPWLISLNGTFGYVNGHNDFKYTSDNYHMYSPYYDSDWYNVFNVAQNG